MADDSNNSVPTLFGVAPKLKVNDVMWALKGKRLNLQSLQSKP